MSEHAPEKAATPEKGRLSAEAARLIMREVLERVRRLGVGAVDLWRKLRKDRSPQAMLDTLRQADEANRARREQVAAQAEELYARIVERKQAYAKAAPARRRILEAELASLLVRHKAAERELTALLENERVLAQTIGRVHELTAMGMAGVTELQIDDLVDEVEAGVAEAEARLDAARDLDRAGRRRERSAEKEALWEALEDFEGEVAPQREESSRPAAELPERDAPTKRTEQESTPEFGE